MMGDFKVVSAGHNGDVLCDEDRLYSSSSPPLPLPASNPDTCSIGSESWAIAERTTQEIVCRIQPTLATDHKRKEVIKYVQRLIRKRVGCEVRAEFALLSVYQAILSSGYFTIFLFLRFCLRTTSFFSHCRVVFLVM